MEAGRKVAEGVTSYDDMQLPEENMSAKAAHTRVRCHQIIPEKDDVELSFTRY